MVAVSRQSVNQYPRQSKRLTNPDNKSRPLLLVDNETEVKAALSFAGGVYEVRTISAEPEYFGRQALIWSDDLKAIPDMLYGLSCHPIKLLPTNELTASVAEYKGFDWTQFSKWAKTRVRLWEPEPVKPFDTTLILTGAEPPIQSTPGPAIANEPPQFFNNTDLGNAKRLVQVQGKDMRFCHPWGTWMVWDGKRWSNDDTGAAERKAKDTIMSLYDIASKSEDFTIRESLTKHALKSESAARISSMLSLTRSEPGIPVLPDDIDRDPWLFNCANGTLNLKTGQLEPHNRANFITKTSSIEYDPKAPYLKWQEFLYTIMDGNRELVQFLKRAIGYSMTARTTEHVIFFLYGNGANGKSTFIEAIRSVLGDYSQQMPTDSLMAKDRGNGIPNDIARLKGARFVACSETEEGRRLSEVQVKQLTGGDTISARFLHGEFFDFRPTHKLFVTTNHKPIIRGTDDGIWRRIRLVPFAVTIPEANRDPLLLQKLREESAGILAWAVQGCLEWQKNGLGLPSEVKQATDEYRREMDALGDFLKDCCEEISMYTVPASDLYKAYQDWCESGGEFCYSQRKFGAALTERGFDRKRYGAGMIYNGLKLK